MNKLLKILVILAVIIAVVFAAVYLMSLWEPTRGIAESATGLGNQAADYVKDNIPIVTAYAGTASLAIGGALAFKKSTENKVAAITTAANSQIDGLVSEKDKIADDLKQKTESLTSLETKNIELETLTKEAKDKLTALERERDNWKLQFQTLDDKITTQGIAPNPNDKRVIEANTPVVG